MATGGKLGGIKPSKDYGKDPTYTKQVDQMNALIGASQAGEQWAIDEMNQRKADIAEDMRKRKRVGFNARGRSRGTILTSSLGVFNKPTLRRPTLGGA